MFKTHTRRTMMALTLFVTFACNTAAAEPVAKVESEYDVVVYGGTSAGIIAAIQAKKMGM
jgi:glutamate racemase